MRSAVSKLLENPLQTKKDKVLNLVSPAYFRKRAAQHILSQIKREELPVFNQQLEIAQYQGRNSTVASISNYLQARSHPAIIAAFVQGSIATGEEIAYSDFDGIVLVNESRLENAYAVESLLEILEKTGAMMLQHDALQHHGWNILTDSELAAYPDSELPLVLLENSKVIYPVRKINLYYNLLVEQEDYKKTLLQLCSSLTSKAESNSPARTFHHFKSWVSQVLLLPAVYLQAKENKPVFKKESFNRLHELPATAAGIIQQYSKLRREWNQQEATINAELNFKRWSATGKLADRLATPVPERYKSWLSDTKRTEITKLTSLLLQSLR
jgi:hypothetical protein